MSYICTILTVKNIVSIIIHELKKNDVMTRVSKLQQKQNTGASLYSFYVSRH